MQMYASQLLMVLDQMTTKMAKWRIRSDTKIPRRPNSALNYGALAPTTGCVTQIRTTDMNDTLRGASEGKGGSTPGLS